MSIYSSLGSLFGAKFGWYDEQMRFKPDTRPIGGAGPKTPEDYFYYGKYLAPEVPGTLDLAGFNTAKAYELQRLEERNLQAEKFAEQSQAFNVQMAQQAQASGTFFERLGQLDERLSSIKAGLPTAASQVSSIRQYSQLSKRAMENTSRYLAELERFKAPEAPAIDFTFKNPITGESLELGTQFSDVFSDDYSASSAAREMILGDFRRISQEQTQSALEAMQSYWGKAEDYGGTVEGYREKLKDPYLTGAQKNYYQQALKATEAPDIAAQYGEAAALAQLGGYTDWISGTHVGTSGGSGSFSIDPITMFYGQDANAILEDYISKTAERLEISRMGDVGALQEEFNRRQQNAQAQYQMYLNQQARNQQQAQQVEAEKQRTRAELERQKAEYAQSLGEFGSGSANRGDGIEFTDTRPQ